MKRFFKIAGITLIILLVAFIIYYFLYLCPIFRELSEVKSLSIENVKPAGIVDGDYPGYFSFAGMEVKVIVSIRDSLISEIEILQGGINKYGKKAEKITEIVIKKQSLQVDVISGATITSKALLKAMENALKKGVLISNETD